MLHKPVDYTLPAQQPRAIGMGIFVSTKQLIGHGVRHVVISQVVRRATVECFNSFQQQWTELEPLNHPRGGHVIAVLDVGGESIEWGLCGQSDSLVFDNTECFNPATQTWSMVPSMTVPRCGLGVCTCDEGMDRLRVQRHGREDGIRLCHQLFRHPFQRKNSVQGCLQQVHV